MSQPKNHSKPKENYIGRSEKSAPGYQVRLHSELLRRRAEHLGNEGCGEEAWERMAVSMNSRSFSWLHKETRQDAYLEAESCAG